MTEPKRDGPDRRGVITTALASVSASALAACTGSREPSTPADTPASRRSSSTSTPPSSSSTTRQRLATPQAWQPHENEVEAWCKLTAVRQTVAALTVDGTRPGSPPTSALRPLARQVEDMEQSVVEVVYPQYGGLTRDRRQASVMLVLDLIGITNGSSESTRTSMTLDVRLRRRDSWQVTDVIIPTARQNATPVPDGVGQLLRNGRIDLPREARLDLASGRIDPTLVTVMSALSQRWHLGVHVLRTGHPENVFDTDRRSNHSRGRAVDIWSLDQIPVIDHDRAPWREVMEAAADEGADEVGGPADIGGAGPPYFTDHVHQDHLHVAFEWRGPN